MRHQEDEKGAVTGGQSIRLWKMRLASTDSRYVHHDSGLENKTQQNAS